MGTQFGQNCLSSCGKSKGSHPRGTHNVPVCSPLGRRAKEPPSFAESNGHTNHTRLMPDSYPNHAPPHSLPPSPTHPTSWMFWWGLQRATGVFGGECICLVCPASNRCCLPTASAQSGPTAGSPTNPTIQLQSCESSANHTLESYPRVIPRIIPPIQSSRPDYGKEIHAQVCSPLDAFRSPADLGKPVGRPPPSDRLGFRGGLREDHSSRSFSFQP